VKDSKGNVVHIDTGDGTDTSFTAYAGSNARDMVDDLAFAASVEAVWDN